MEELLQDYPEASLAESFISTTFITILSTAHHYLMMPADSLDTRQTSTAAALHNFSRAFALSNDPNDLAYRDTFKLWGDLSDHFAIFYVRMHPWFSLLLQTIGSCMLIVFVALILALVYRTFLSSNKNQVVHHRRMVVPRGQMTS